MRSSWSLGMARAKIERMVRLIAERFHPERIVLFGSYARGTAGPDSDVDLLVIMPVTGSKRDTRVGIRTLLHASGLPKDVIVATPEEADRYRDSVGTIIGPAMREGEVLYERRR